MCEIDWDGSNGFCSREALWDVVNTIDSDGTSQLG